MPIGGLQPIYLMAAFVLAVALLACLTVRCAAEPPVIAVQSGMTSYGTRVDSWVSPVTGINYVKDDPYVTNLASTDTRCYGAEHIKFANGEDALYQCTRASSSTISYRFPGIPNGNYRLFLIESDDKWTEFRNGNNGREFHVIIENQFADSISPFGKIGLAQAAVQTEYCVTITDGDLEVTLDKTMFPTSSQAVLLCGLRLEKDNGSRGACPTPLTRYDTYWLPYRGVWTYSINCAGGPWRSPNGFMWQLDYGFYQPSGGVLVATGVPVGYDGMRETDSALLRNTADVPVMQRRRVGDDTKYSLPLAPGNYMVVIWFLEWSDGAAIQWTYGGRKFDMFFEGNFVMTVDIYATCGAAYRACPVVFRNVAVTDGFFDLSFGNTVKMSATINGIQIKPEDGSPVPEYINYPGKFLADTGKDRPFNWPGQQGSVLYAINCGGGELSDSADGLFFTVDSFYNITGSSTNVYGDPSAMRNTSYPQVYKTMRTSANSVEYSIPVYDAGIYTVRLYFCEYEYSTGTRVVSVSLQGTQVDQFDILARGGGTKNGAVELDYEVTVAANQAIQIVIGKVSGRPPLINGIEVRPGPIGTPRTLPVVPPIPPLGDYEQFPVPWDGSVPQPDTIAPGPFPPYVPKTMPDGRELVFAINFAPPMEDCCCSCTPYPCGCGTYVSTENITYMEATPFFVPPYNSATCYGDVAGVHTWPGANVPYANDLGLGSCFASVFRAYFPNVAPGEYRLRTLHHEEKWSAALEFAADGAGGRGGYLDVNGMRINTMDYIAKIGAKSVLYSVDHCITVDSRGHIELASLMLPQQISGPRVHALELWKKDWTGTCPFSIQDRQDLIADDGSNCFVPVSCIPCHGNATFGVLPCLRPWAEQGAIVYAINSGGTPYHSNVSGIDYSVDVKFGHGPWHRTGYAVGYDHNNGVIDGTEDDFLFTSRRSGTHGYWLPVTYAGRYLLVLGAMEWDRGYIGGRVWDLYLEGQLVDTVDVFWRCGSAYRACYLAYYVYVWDGLLNIWVSVKQGGAGVNNILVIRDDGSPNSGLPMGVYLPPYQKPFNWRLQNSNVLYAINCGGGEVVDPNTGFIWNADFYTAATDTSSTSRYSFYTMPTDKATVPTALYGWQRQGTVDIRFDVPLPASGMTITLEIFCSEYEYAQSGRTQTINVENGQATDGPFDVWTCAGNSQNECKRTFTGLVIADDVLSFAVQRVSGRNALINAFRVTVTAGLPTNASTPPPAVIPVFGPSTCPAGGLGCACLPGNSCNVMPPAQPSAPPQTDPPTAPPGTFAPAPQIPSTVTASGPGSSSASNKNGGKGVSAGVIAAIVVVVVLVAVAVAVLLFVFRERIFGGGSSARKPTFHEEEMYAKPQ